MASFEFMSIDKTRKGTEGAYGSLHHTDQHEHPHSSNRYNGPAFDEVSTVDAQPHTRHRRWWLMGLTSAACVTAVAGMKIMSARGVSFMRQSGVAGGQLLRSSSVVHGGLQLPIRKIGRGKFTSTDYLEVGK